MIPQIQIAEDSAAVLALGNEPKFLSDNLKNPVEYCQKSGRHFWSLMTVRQATCFHCFLTAPPLFRQPVFLAYAKIHGQDRVTWQPAPGVRIAAVVAYLWWPAQGYASKAAVLCGKWRIAHLAWIFDILSLSGQPQFFAVISSLFVCR